MNDIDILENLMNRTVRIQPNLESAVCSIDEQLAIRNLISENKELKEEYENLLISYNTEKVENTELNNLLTELKKRFGFEE